MSVFILLKLTGRAFAIGDNYAAITYTRYYLYTILYNKKKQKIIIIVYTLYNCRRDIILFSFFFRLLAYIIERSKNTNFSDSAVLSRLSKL